MTTGYRKHISDEALVSLCRERLPGDPRPFTALVSRYEQRVLASCFRLMGDRREAEDQAQEVFIKVYRGLRRFEGRSKFSTWLFQITVNTCRTALKRRASRPDLEETDLLTLEALLPSPVSPEEVTFAQAEVDMITQAMQMLSEDERIVLTLRETDGLSYQVIAQVLEIGLSAAKMRVMRARLQLQQAYRAVTGEEACPM